MGSKEKAEPPRILVAEDSRTQAEQLAYLLEEGGYVVEVAQNGLLALEAARRTPCDLVISDVMMPEMDGYGLSRALKSDPALRDIPVILVTSMSSPHDVIKGLECGADNFITKPYDEKYLLARINYLLTNAKLRASSVVRSGIEIDLDGERVFVNAERQQILDLLISTYATAVRFSDEAAGRERLLRESYETMKVLYRSAEALNQAKNEADVIAEALQRCRDLPFVRSCWLWIVDESGAVVRTGMAGIPPSLAASLNAPEDCSCRRALLSGKPAQAINVVACERMTRAAPDTEGVARHASVPLPGQWQPLGILNVIGRVDDRPFSDEELRVLSALASQLAAALDRALMHDALEREVGKRTAELRGEIAEREAAEAALREAAARLERAVRGSSAGLWEWDLRDNRAFYSPRFKTMLGYEADDVAMTAEFFLRALHPDDRERVAAAATEHVKKGTPFSAEFRMATKQGEYRWFSAIGEATRDDDGRATIMAGSISDITRRLAAEEQLRQAQKMEAIGNLTGGIAHDFNNMLAVVIGNLDLLRLEVASSPEACELVDMALAASLRGGELTKSLLAFARRQPLQPQLLRINELLQQSERLLARALGENIAVDFNLSDDVWKVHADPSQIEAALFNLVINARDAMPGGGQIIVSTRNARLDEAYAAQNVEVTAGDYVALEVSDTGHGMTPEILARVFEPFFTTKEKGKGTGLGLAMVFGFVKQSGGHIKIYSEVGHGTTVRLYLPRGDTVEAVEDARAETPASSTRGNETILIVEDNVLVRQAAIRQMKGMGYNVVEAENGAEAIALLERDSNVDLVFSDVIMPGKMNGGELAAEIGSRWPRIKLLLTSGFPQGLLENGSRIPAEIALLGKPYRMEELFRKLRDILDGP